MSKNLLFMEFTRRSKLGISWMIFWDRRKSCLHPISIPLQRISPSKRTQSWTNLPESHSLVLSRTRPRKINIQLRIIIKLTENKFRLREEH
jgi:hypothetical protein